MGSFTNTMAECVKCGTSYSDKRRQIGYDTCLRCGSHEANRESYIKSRQVAPAFNKGAYQYITSKQIAKTIGR